jgi:hypothetical protein
VISFQTIRIDGRQERYRGRSGNLKRAAAMLNEQRKVVGMRTMLEEYKECGKNRENMGNVRDPMIFEPQAIPSTNVLPPTPVWRFLWQDVIFQ